MRINKSLTLASLVSLTAIATAPAATAQSVELSNWLSPGSVSALKNSPFGSVLEDPVAARMEGGVIAELNKERAAADNPPLVADSETSKSTRELLASDGLDFLFESPFEDFMKGFSLDRGIAVICGPSDSLTPSEIRASVAENANSMGLIDQERGYFLAAPGALLDPEFTNIGFGYHEEAGRGCLLAMPVD